MSALAQKSRRFKKYTQILWSSGKTKHVDKYIYIYIISILLEIKPEENILIKYTKNGDLNL